MCEDHSKVVQGLEMQTYFLKSLSHISKFL